MKINSFHSFSQLVEHIPLSTVCAEVFSYNKRLTHPSQTPQVTDEIVCGRSPWELSEGGC